MKSTGVSFKVFALTVVVFLVFLGGRVVASAAGDEQAANPLGEHYEIFWLLNRGVPSADAYIIKEVEDRYNITLNLTSVPSRSDIIPKLTTLLAAGNMPDVFWGAGDRTAKLVQQGAARVTMDEFKQHRPHGYKMLLGALGSDAAISNISSIHPGHMQVFPLLLYRPGQYSVHFYVWRMDILRDLGFDVAPSTIDGMGQVFGAYKGENPNKYPYTGSGMAFSRSFSEVFYAHDAIWNQYYNKDGEIVYGSVLPETKAALAVLRDWYARGYIDPEWITNTEGAKNGAFEEGLTITDNWIGFGKFYAGLENTVREVSGIPNAEVVVAPAPMRQEGYEYRHLRFPNITSIGMSFGVHLENERDKMYRMMLLGEDLNTDRDLYLLTHWGKEGEGYQWREDGTLDYSIIPRPELRYAWGNIWDWYAIDGLWNQDFRAFTKNQEEKVAEDVFLGPGGSWDRKTHNYAASAIIFPILDENDNPILFEVENEGLETMAAQIITGAKPLDYFDEIAANWYQGGGEKYLKRANEVYVVD
jgi:putative aldouronate transport system substrate-binding protein